MLYINTQNKTKRSLMIRALIIDDEQDSRLTLSALLTRFCKNVEVVGEAGTVKEAVKLIKSLEPDLVFLDIEMPQENGFQLFKYFKNISFEVIFTTAYDEYAVKAFRYCALDYLLKPINLEELRESLLRVNKQRIEPEFNRLRLQTLEYNLDNNFQKIALPILNGLIFVDVDDIIRLEADNNYTLVFTTKGKHLISKSLREYEMILNNTGFFRVNRSNLINLKYIKRYIKNKNPLIELNDGTQLKLPISKKQEFLNHVGYVR